MINKQNFSFHIFEEKIPLSKTLGQLIKIKKFKKINIYLKETIIRYFLLLVLLNQESSKEYQKIQVLGLLKLVRLYLVKMIKIIRIKNKQIEAKNKGYNINSES